MVELEKKTIYAKNMFGVKSYYDVNVLIKSDDGRILITKSYNGNLSKLKLDEKDKCYVLVDEIFK